jgi:hypothetical protein
VAHRPERVRRVVVLDPVRGRRLETELHCSHARAVGILEAVTAAASFSLRNSSKVPRSMWEALALCFRAEGVVEGFGLDDERPLRRVMRISHKCSRMKAPYPARVQVRCAVQEDHGQLVSMEQYRAPVMPSCEKASTEVVDGSL